MFAIFAKTYPSYCFLPLLVLLSWTAASAQLNAEFSMDRPGGCSPLAVSFTNRTTGASANAVYSWDFDNGNASLLKDGGAIYTIEQTYTITLTVQDGPQQSSKTQQRTVYKA